MSAPNTQENAVPIVPEIVLLIVAATVVRSLMAIAVMISAVKAALPHRPRPVRPSPVLSAMAMPVLHRPVAPRLGQVTAPLKASARPKAAMIAAGVTSRVRAIQATAALSPDYRKTMSLRSRNAHSRNSGTSA